jgi:hypothetical protein
MNNYQQHIFGQLNDLAAKNAAMQQQIETFKAQLQAAIAKGAKISFPSQWKAGVIAYPGYMPFPFIQEIEFKSKSGAPFGRSVEISVGSIKIDIDLPVYLERFTASLIKTHGEVPGEPDPIEDPGLGYFLPLSFRGWRINPFFVDGIGNNIPLQRYLCDFYWRAYFEKKQKNITNDFLPSTVLDGDEQQGFKFDCEYPVKRGETLTIEAQPVKAIPNSTDGFKVTFNAHFIKMLLDPSKIAKAQAEAEMF